MIDLLTLAFDAFTTDAIIPAILVLLLQLLLCFMAKKIWIKLLPAIVLAAAIVIFSVCFYQIDHLINVIFLFIAFRSFHLLLACGIGWGIWAIVKIMRRKVPNGTTEQIS